MAPDEATDAAAARAQGAEVSQRADERVLDRWRGRGEWVLVVDDEAGVRNVSRRILQRYGYQVLTAENGEEGVATYIAHRDKVAVVITDMAMPIMDGPALIAALYALDPMARIIGASGQQGGAGEALSRRAGVTHFVAKPYVITTLLRTLRAVLDARP
jgi:DNA-binding NtrC family response regulator